MIDLMACETIVVSSAPDALVADLIGQGVTPYRVIDPEAYEGRLLAAMAGSSHAIIYDNGRVGLAQPQAIPTRVSGHAPILNPAVALDDAGPAEPAYDDPLADTAELPAVYTRVDLLEKIEEYAREYEENGTRENRSSHVARRQMEERTQHETQ